MAVRSDIATVPRWKDHFAYRGQRCELVVDPMVNALTDGDVIFGWAGDNRLALYASVDLGAWILMRYDEDRVIRVVTVKSMADIRTADIVPALVLHLITHDSRRVNVMQITSAHNRRVDADNDAQLQTWAEEEGGPRLAHALLVDMDRAGAQSSQVVSVKP